MDDVANRRGIEDRDVGHQPGPQDAALAQMDAGRRPSSVILRTASSERQQLLLADERAEDARERSPRARMRFRLRQLAVLGLRARVGADTDQRMP